MGRLRSRRFWPVMFGQGAAKPYPVYGVSWGKSGTLNAPLTRTDDSAAFSAAAGVDAGAAANDFDTASIYSEITEVTDAFDNVFVRIPKFYIRKTDGVGVKTWQIMKKRWGGAYLPKCFVASNGSELPYVDIGKYNASLDGSGTKLESKTGTYPLMSKNIVQFRGYAQANGAGYQQLDIHVVDMLQTLFYVEFATLHSQSIMNGYVAGQYTDTHLATATEEGANRIVVPNATAALYEVGQSIGVGTSQGGNQIFANRNITGKTVIDASNTAIEFDGAPVNIAIGNRLYNTGYKSGACDAVSATSGSKISNSTGQHPCMYRGIENPWGSMWQFVDGVNITDNQAWVCADAAQYASDLFAAPYLQLAYANHAANGYPTAMGYDAARPYAVFPVAVGGASNTYYSDYYYQSLGQRIALVGGYWSHGSAAGVSGWDLSSSSSGAPLSFGGRLVLKAS